MYTPLYPSGCASTISSMPCSAARFVSMYRAEMSGRYMSSAETYTNGRGPVPGSLEGAATNVSHTLRATPPPTPVNEPSEAPNPGHYAPESRFSTSYPPALCAPRSSGLPESHNPLNKPPTSARTFPSARARLYCPSSRSVPSVCTTPDTPGSRCAYVSGCSASAFCQVTCRIHKL